jgi:DNA invertase Pin-like site-specific DNA recombinase
MNCIVYARVSTDKQAEKDLSIPAQLEAMRSYARQHGWTIAREFIEPGASAKTTGRPALQGLLSLVRDSKSKIDVLLVHKVDRLARNVYDHATIKVLLKQHDIRLASVVENLDDSVPGQLVENIMASIAQFYSANLSEETRKGMRQKVLKGGWPHRPPRGYVTVKDRGGHDSHIQVHPREGPLVLRAFELYSTGWYSMTALTNRLAKDGLISSSGGPIPKSHMYRMLTNRFYSGRVRWKDLDVQGLHPVLVPQALFDRVRSVIQKRYRHPGAKARVAGFPLRGFAICARCRGRMTGEWRKRWGYYRCSRQSYRRELCDARLCNVKRAHADLERICQQVRLHRSTAAAIQRAAELEIARSAASRTQRMSDIQTGRAALVTAEMRLTDAFTDGDVSPEIYKSKTADLRTKRIQLEEDSTRLSIDPAAVGAKVKETLDVATALWDLYEAFDDAKRAELLRSVFSSIVLGHEGIVGFSLKAPFDKLASMDKDRLQQAGTNEKGELVHAILDAA